MSEGKDIMEIDYSPRCSGKTTRMIEWLKEDPNRVLVVHTIGYRDNLKRQYPELSERFHVAHTLMDSHLHISHESVLGFDNLDLILAHMFKRRIGIASITKEET